MSTLASTTSACTRSGPTRRGSSASTAKRSFPSWAEAQLGPWFAAQAPGKEPCVSWRDKPVIRTALAVQKRFGEDRGGFLAAGISYYAFLSLFPLLLLALSVIGFLLAGDPAAQRDWAMKLSASVPGLEPIIGDNLRALVNGRGATGAVGLAGLLWTGMGVASAGTIAVSQVFRITPRRGL